MDTNKGQTQDYTLYMFLLKLIQKSNVRCDQHKQIELKEEDAYRLTNLLMKEGYFNLNDVNACSICALECLEKKIISQVKQQIEIVKKARSFYSHPDNAKYYKLCPKHLPKQVPENQGMNQVQPVPQLPPPLQAKPQPFVPPQQPLVYVPVAQPQIAYYPEQVSYMPIIRAISGPQVNFDTFVPIPTGVDPFTYMANYNEWVNYFQHNSGHKRMAYTRNFKLEEPEEKPNGRKFP